MRCAQARGFARGARWRWITLMGICCVGKRKFQPVAVQQLMALLRELRVDQPLRSTEKF